VQRDILVVQGGGVVASVMCPRCGVAFNNGATYVITGASRTAHDWVTTCTNIGRCGRAILLTVYKDMKNLPSGSPVEAAVNPLRSPSYAPEGVPEKVAKDFLEALACRSGGHLYAAALVSRRALQAAARSVVGPKKDLQAEIDAIPPDRLTDALRQAAHQIRYVGNDAAHADEVTAEEVDALLEFTEMVFDAVFTMPAKVARMQQARVARKEVAKANKGDAT
jgi:hypothetical protein